MNVLVLNSGSSTLRFQIIRTDLDRIDRDDDRRLARGLVERIGGHALLGQQTSHRGREIVNVFSMPWERSR